MRAKFMAAPANALGIFKYLTASGAAGGCCKCVPPGETSVAHPIWPAIRLPVAFWASYPDVTHCNKVYDIIS